MPRFKATIATTITYYQDIEFEADSLEQADVIALDKWDMDADEDGRSPEMVQEVLNLTEV
jgi:hypothetical protein